MDHANTEKTILSEQSQNPSQAGSASTSISKDVGANLSQETSSSGGGLDARLDKADMANASDLGKSTTQDYGMKVGSEDDAHEKAAGKQP